jgi:hypothetical protein
MLQLDYESQLETLWMNAESKAEEMRKQDANAEAEEEVLGEQANPQGQGTRMCRVCSTHAGVPTTPLPACGSIAVMDDVQSTACCNQPSPPTQYRCCCCWWGVAVSPGVKRVKRKPKPPPRVELEEVEEGSLGGTPTPVGKRQEYGRDKRKRKVGGAWGKWGLGGFRQTGPAWTGSG